MVGVCTYSIAIQALPVTVDLPRQLYYLFDIDEVLAAIL